MNKKTTNIQKIILNSLNLLHGHKNIKEIIQNNF